VGNAAELASTADAEGTLATAATDDETTTLTARDTTAPQADAIVVSVSPTRVDASVTASDAWSATVICWTVDGRPAGSGTTTSISGLATGSHKLDAVISDSAGNTTSRTTTVDVPANDEGPAAPAATAPPPPAAAPPPATAPPSDAPAPRVLAARILQRGSVWLARVLIRDGDRVQLTLTRKPYLKNHRSPCGRLERTPHPRPGRQGRLVATIVEQRSVRIRLSAAMHRALRRQGRYELSIVALDREGRRSPTTQRRVTVCTTMKGRTPQ
jgi:hypothetical protein